MPNEVTDGPHPFQVKFGKTARTIEYRDEFGPVAFTLEWEKAEKLLVLEHHAARRGRLSNYDAAYVRTRTFLENAGYEVRESGQAKIPPLMTEADVAGWVRM